MLTTSSQSIHSSPPLYHYFSLLFLILYLTQTSKSTQPTDPHQPYPTRILNLSVTAVQNENQIFFSYLPYISSCYYNQSNIIQGNMTIELLDSIFLYKQVQYENMIVFWTPVKNGLSIMSIIGDLLDNGWIYDGYILYDSEVKDFQRNLILYTLNSTNLTFYYTLPRLQLSNSSLIIQIINAQAINLNQQCQQILSTCQNIQNATYFNFVYVGNDSFMFVCGLLQKGFIFVPGVQQTGTVINLDMIGPGKYYLSVNPYLLTLASLKIQNQNWNSIILSQNSTQQSNLYFFVYDFNLSTYFIVPLTSMQTQLSLLIDRIWGISVKKQFSSWMDIATSLNLTNQNLYFPGDIVSLFVSDHSNIFVQSVTDTGVNYLCVFDDSLELYWNISYVGNIIYYGNKAVFIYDKQYDLIYLIEIDRPIYTLDPNLIEDTTVGSFYNFFVNITCQRQILALNYTIMWTTPQYPSSYVSQKITNPIISNQIIYGFQVKNLFEIIGPDFQLIVNAPPNIETVTIDSSSITINRQSINIIDIEIQDNYATIIYSSNDTIYSINSQRQTKTLCIRPCGFDQISTTSRTSDGYYIITNQNNRQCSCTSNFAMCQIVSFNQMYATLSQGSQHMYKNRNRNGKGYGFVQILNGLNNDTVIGFPNLAIKRNLYGLIKDGLIVSILQNNTVLLINIQEHIILGSISINCQQQNSTNGDIYISQFYDPSLILFCQQSSTLYQFIIRNNKIIPRRQIPLYNFKTRAGIFTFYPAFSFVFISVDPLVQIYPLPNNCCVLRLDPHENTVSVIVQVIQASSVIVVTTYRNIDIAVFKSNAVSTTSTSTCIIQLYFPDTWVTLNQTNHSQILSQDKILIVYQSVFYNFAAQFQLPYIFNLTNINLNLSFNTNSKSSFENLTLNFNTISNDGTLIGNANYNLNNYLCGPVFSSVFYRTINNLTNLQIIQTDVLTKNKMLGNIGIQFIQLINPQKFIVASLSLNQLVFAISLDKMYVYGKVVNGVQMKQVTNFQLPQKRCTYYLYHVINQTAATLISNCQKISYSLKQPLLTVNYNLVTGIFTYSYQWMDIPLALRQVYTIVRPNQSTLVMGILQGPMNSQTGRLFLCDGNQCSPLYISTTDLFLLNYAVKSTNTLYIVMTIDYQTIQIFLNPQVQPNEAKILCNYTMNYTQFINQRYCSVIRILTITQTSSFSILSCINYYYYIQIFFINSTIKIVQQFLRYAQCDVEDQFKPLTISGSDGQLQIIFAECKQNDYTFKLQAFETINNSYPTIYTGYLQIFLMNGPQGPNCSTGISPNKILPISISMQYPLFMTYTIPGPSQTVINKFIYSQINGILIDNYISNQTSIQIRYQPISQQQKFPSIQFHAINQLHSINQSVFTNQLQTVQKNILYYIISALFILANLVTFICLICYLCQRNSKQNGRKTVMRQSTAIGGVEQLQYEDNLKNVFNVCKDNTVQVNNRKTTRIANKNRPSQIQMFFVKKK